MGQRHYLELEVRGKPSTFIPNWIVVSLAKRSRWGFKNLDIINSTPRWMYDPGCIFIIEWSLGIGVFNNVCAVLGRLWPSDININKSASTQLCDTWYYPVIKFYI